MLSASTFHVVATELAVGTIALAGGVILLRMIIALKAEDGIGRFGDLLDSASLVAAIAGLLALPFAIITGVLSAPGDGLDNPLLFNKMILSCTAIGLWGAWLHGRFTLGSRLWTKKPLALIQGMIGLAACGCTLTVASLGGKYLRGESLMGPFGKPLQYSIAMDTTSAVIALLAAIAALATVLLMMPKPSKVD